MVGVALPYIRADLGLAFAGARNRGAGRPRAAGEAEQPELEPAAR